MEGRASLNLRNNLVTVALTKARSKLRHARHNSRASTSQPVWLYE